MTNNSQALVPVGERSVDFYGDAVMGVIIEQDGDRRVYVPLRPICRYLGLDWSAQYRRIQRDDVLASAMRFVVIVPTNPQGGDPETLALPLDFLPGWLFGIDTARLRLELRPVLNRYRQECFRTLARAFPADLVIPQLSETDTTDEPAFPGFVYIAQGGSHTKIGAARDARKRVKSLNAALPFPVRLLHTIAADDMFALERQLHALYRHAGRHHKGEWFSLTPEDCLALQRIDEPVTGETMPSVIQCLKLSTRAVPIEAIS